MGEPTHHGRDFLNATGRTGEGIEALEADQGVENVNRLLECLGGWSSMLLDKSPDDDTKTLPSPLVSRPYHLLKIRVERGQGSESASHESVGVPETAEDCNVFVQRVERFWSAEGRSQLLHPSMGRERVAQGFEESSFGAELVVDGHASNIGLAGDGLDAETGEAIAGHE